MIKKTMTYEDLNGQTVTEDFYFGISKAELIDLEVAHSKTGGYRGMLEKIIAEEDSQAMLATFKDIIAMSIGRRSDDGKRFIKSDEIMMDFQQSPAYSDLLMSFYTEPGAAVEFVAGIMPSDMAEQIAKAQANAEQSKDEPPKERKYLNEFSPEEIGAMDEDVFKAMKGRTEMRRLSPEQLQACFAR